MKSRVKRAKLSADTPKKQIHKTRTKKRKLHPENDISGRSIRRLGKLGSAGKKRMSTRIQPEVRTRYRNFMKSVLSEAVLRTNHAKRRTISVDDYIYGVCRINNLIFQTWK
jgi:histone H3/H4